MIKGNNKSAQAINNFFIKKKESNLLDIWHYLMLGYGWIPYEEFLKLDAYIVNELVYRLNKTNEEQRRSMKK